MRDRARSFCARDLDHSFRDQRPRDARPEKILVLVNRARLKHRKDKIAGEFFAKIFDHTFRGAGLERFLFEPCELFFLTNVGAKGSYLRAIIIFEPAKDHRGVESAGISQNDFHLTKDTKDTKVRGRRNS